MKAALLGMPQDRVTLRFLMTAAGPINSGDVQLANASQGQIISFNMDPSEAIIAQAKRLGTFSLDSPPPPYHHHTFPIKHLHSDL